MPCSEVSDVETLSTSGGEHVNTLLHVADETAPAKETAPSDGWVGWGGGGRFPFFILLNEFYAQRGLREVRGGPCGEDTVAGASDPRGGVDQCDGDSVRAGGGCPPDRPVRRRAPPCRPGRRGSSVGASPSRSGCSGGRPNQRLLQSNRSPLVVREDAGGAPASQNVFERRADSGTPRCRELPRENGALGAMGGNRGRRPLPQGMGMGTGTGKRWGEEGDGRWGWGGEEW